MKTYYQRKREAKKKRRKKKPNTISHLFFSTLFFFISSYSLFGSKWIFFSYNYIQQQQERKFLLDTGSSHKNLSFFTFQTVLFIIPLFFLIFSFYFFFIILLFLRWAFIYILNCVFKKKKTKKKISVKQKKKRSERKWGPYFKTLFDKLSYLSKAFVWYKNRRRTKKKRT